jgi:hypothetical protein
MRPSPTLVRSGTGAALLVLSIVFVACASAAGAPLQSDSPATPGPSVVAPPPSAPPTLAPVEPTPAPVEPTDPPADPPATPRPADPTPTPAPAFTDAELELIAHIRPDARHDCTPRRSDLPDGATAGVECRPSVGPALRVGYYALPTNRAAARAYFDRIVTSGVEPNSGDCWSGVAGDVGWIPGDGEPDLVDNRDYGIVVANSPYVTHRIGCFLHEGTANVRLTCGDGRYVGVLGRNDDLEALFRWSEQYPLGVPMDTPTAPGLCITC